MKCILHIGTEKTGTSSIQMFLERNKTSLEECGYHYFHDADRVDCRSISAYCVAWDEDVPDEFLDQPMIRAIGRKSFKDNFEKKLSEKVSAVQGEIHTFIISSEHLHSRANTDHRVNVIADLLGKFFSEVTVICYVREQFSMGLSSYSTRIKSGETVSIEESFSKCTPKNFYYNHFDMLAKWSKSFGQENISVRVFDRAHLIDGDVVEDFCAQIDGEVLKKFPRLETKANTSLNSVGQCLGRAINLALSPRKIYGLDDPAHSRSFNALERNFSGPVSVSDPKIAYAIYEAFRPSNRDLNAKYFGKDDDLFALPEPKIRSAVLEDVDDVKIAEVFKALLSEQQEVPERYIDTLRDVAFAMANVQPETALELLRLAQRLRPHGPAINHKILELEWLLRETSSA